MAEPAKQVKAQSDKPRVLALESGEGGITLPGLWDTKSRIDLRTAWVKSAGLEMELDRGLGGVVIHYTAREDGAPRAHLVIVPMGHLRWVELSPEG